LGFGIFGFLAFRTRRRRLGADLLPHPYHPFPPLLRTYRPYRHPTDTNETVTGISRSNPKPKALSSEPGVHSPEPKRGTHAHTLLDTPRGPKTPNALPPRPSILYPHSHPQPPTPTPRIPRSTTLARYAPLFALCIPGLSPKFNPSPPGSRSHIESYYGLKFR
jgi:hypothetical protein